MDNRKLYIIKTLLLTVVFFTKTSISQNCLCDVWKKEEKINTDLLRGKNKYRPAYQ